MENLNDSELLKRYTAEGDEKAFAALVARHASLVYGTALGKVAGDPEAARDVAQAVFVDLARKAATLRNQEALAGWLHTSARFAANRLIRTEQRRRMRERAAVLASGPTNEPFASGPLDELTPILDDALAELPDKDREPLLRRYFGGERLRAIGECLGISENAARMRVDRGIEKLRALLEKRGVTSSTAALGIALEEASAAAAAPAGMAGAWASAALLSAKLGLGTAPAGALALLPKLKLAGAIALLGGLVTWSVLQRQQIHSLSSALAAIQAEQGAPLTSLAPPIRSETAGETLEERLERMRLRNEVTMLSRRLNELSNALTAQTLADLQARSELAPEPREPWQLNEQRQPGDFYNVGNATPEAAVETAIWASLHEPTNLASMIHLPDEITSNPELSRQISGLSHLVQSFHVLGNEKGLSQVWLEKRQNIGRYNVVQNVGGEMRTNRYEDLISFQITGADAAGEPLGRHVDMHVKEFDGQWKLIIPGLSPEAQPER